VCVYVYVYVCVCVRDCTCVRERTRELNKLRASNCVCYTNGFLESSGSRTRALETIAYTKKPLHTQHSNELHIHNTQKSPTYTCSYVHTLENGGYRPRLTCSWYKFKKDECGINGTNQTKDGMWGQNPASEKLLGLVYDTLYQTLSVSHPICITHYMYDTLHVSQSISHSICMTLSSQPHIREASWAGI